MYLFDDWSMSPELQSYRITIFLLIISSESASQKM